MCEHDESPLKDSPVTANTIRNRRISDALVLLVRWSQLLVLRQRSVVALARRKVAGN